ILDNFFNFAARILGKLPDKN
ncbi:hypothetical protein CCACVL1_15222, partial [Corchorus capsularis]